MCYKQFNLRKKNLSIIIGIKNIIAIIIKFGVKLNYKSITIKKKIYFFIIFITWLENCLTWDHINCYNNKN